jgi:hypothetical protein
MAMATKKRSEVPPPKTLMQAHELLTRMRPDRAASPQTWLAYYRRSAAMYAEVAEIDRGHHHEARYWANRERAKANTIAAEITPRAASNEPGGSAPDATVHTEQQ